MEEARQLMGLLGEWAEKLRDAFARHQVEYMFIGKGSALMQGFNATTRDLDIFPSKKNDNKTRLLAALEKLNFELEIEHRGKIVSLKDKILAGADFVQMRHPIDLDIVFAPSGFESYEEAAARYKIVINGFPLLSIDGIIFNKRHAKRTRDLNDLELLNEFKDKMKRD